MLGSGDSIGSLVGNNVMTNTKLQRIVSRCGCEFYYASFDDELEEGLEAVPASNTVRKQLITVILIELVTRPKWVATYLYDQAL